VCGQEHLTCGYFPKEGDYVQVGEDDDHHHHHHDHDDDGDVMVMLMVVMLKW
jgi:hypothetical protein